jgi:hypothetical protein
MLNSQRSQYETTHRFNKTQHLVHIYEGKKAFNSDLADQQADQKFSGGFDISKKNICEICFEAKSTNGSCSCNS